MPLKSKCGQTRKGTNVWEQLSEHYREGDRYGFWWTLAETETPRRSIWIFPCKFKRSKRNRKERRNDRARLRLRTFEETSKARRHERIKKIPRRNHQAESVRREKQRKNAWIQKEETARDSECWEALTENRSKEVDTCRKDDSTRQSKGETLPDNLPWRNQSLPASQAWIITLSKVASRISVRMMSFTIYKQKVYLRRTCIQKNVQIPTHQEDKREPTLAAFWLFPCDRAVAYRFVVATARNMKI